MNDFLPLGIQGRGFPTAVMGKFSGRLVIVAGGRCVWDDLARLGVMGAAEGTDIMCVNDVVMHYPGHVKHLYSNDLRMIPHWLNARREQITRKFGHVVMTHTCRNGGAPTHAWPWPGNGTSSLSAVYTGIGLGYESIVLCGAPLDDSGHYFDPPWVESHFTNEVSHRTDNGEMQYWHFAREQIFKGRVKSMSGRTRDLLGSP